MLKNKVQLVIDSLETDDSLMRLDKVASAVSLLKEAHAEMGKDVETGPVPTIEDFQKAATAAVDEFEKKLLEIRERFPFVDGFLGNEKKSVA